MEYQLYDDIQKAACDGRSLEAVKEDIYRLWRGCFGDTKAYTDFYFEWKVPGNRILTIYKGQQISAMLHLNPYTLMVAGKKVESYYIVGVATRIEDRRQGLMKRLLERALYLMNQEKVPFTYLMPAAEAIYYPFDFRIVYEQEAWKKYILDAKETRKESLSTEGDITTLWLDTKNIDDLNRLTDFSNSLLAEQTTVYVLRTQAYYQRLIAEMESGKGSVVLCLQDRELLGYTAYMTEGGLQIAEALYHSKNKREFMSTMAAALPMDEEVERDSNAALDYHGPAIMTRIVNLNHFIKGLSAREDINLVIKVEDKILSENSGNYRLTFSNESCQMIKTDLIPEITMNIASLTRLFFGKLSLEELKPCITGKEPDIILNKLNKINYNAPLRINDVV
ncbi:hypothetical protein acsn021_08980 [Anaerocolumna cellulosilytica]|uniref:Uncharacterized protein n=1 Tax=Anaerocolumna cellulosilytica TaxID=433286 RepID=A0A6S6QW89_9FIRM|nr:GNAT family N-acetyltransferase [Anaerocolumna cellulosilytica]MBB5194385.1 hypothetical protein [Anaerocolumna cellulosilytica]BCJ93329.1 hypothetical protein acsn021_08980 [Anaerocolumna cellulosilytica]